MKRNLSDDNTLKNQQNQIKKYDKYKKALKPKPSPQYKYYDYLTNQQRELDYINYLSNTQISNDKKNVEKQLENAVMLKDKFTANLEAQKKQIELEKQQRQARQKEVFAQDLFDAKKNEQTFREKEAKETLAKRIKAALPMNELQRLKERRKNDKMKLIFDANEKYSEKALKEFVAPVPIQAAIRSKLQRDKDEKIKERTKQFNIKSREIIDKFNEEEKGKNLNIKLRQKKELSQFEKESKKEEQKLNREFKKNVQGKKEEQKLNLNFLKKK
jgi:hypothetical protein